jgi:hypothetical protein
MEIKYVENRKPFYQLQKNYVYELKCELFEYEDEEISTGITELDDNFSDIGYGAVLSLTGLGITATAYTGIVTGGIQKIDVISGGYRYSSTPSMTLPLPPGGIRGSIVGVMTSARRLTSTQSLDKVYIENPGRGYNSSSPPTVSFFGGNGYGTKVNVTVADYGSIGIVTVSYAGQGYTTAPTVTFSPPSGISSAIAVAETTVEDNFSYSTNFDSLEFKFDFSEITFDTEL